MKAIHDSYLNHDSDSWETLASLKSVYNERNYFCTSAKCCTIYSTQEKYNNKKQKMETTHYSRRLNKVLKFGNVKDSLQMRDCPDCGEPLIAKQVTAK
jgi:hypothetical protein